MNKRVQTRSGKPGLFRPGTRTIKDRIFLVLGFVVLVCSLVALLGFVLATAVYGWERLTWSFLTSYPSRFPEKAGLLPALVGSLWLLGLSIVFSVPVGIAAGIFLEEFVRARRLSQLMDFFVFNQGGIPSVLIGLLGLELFVRILGLGPVLLAGALTLSLLILPMIIVTTREALRAVPQSIREASFSLGATRWQTVWYHVLPAARAGILTGVLLGLARVIGETAPLLVVGASAFITYLPVSPMDRFSAIPIQIFSWVSRPQPAFWVNAAAAIIVLLSIVMLFVLFALWFRYRWKIRF